MSQAADHVSVVQFPHPGAEHDPGSAGRQPWNKGRHKRKFLRSEGVYVGADECGVRAPLVFWGEWEPPSLVVQRWPRDGRKPRYLHEPVWELPQPRGRGMNTDPWVFGTTFCYCNCRQRTKRGPSALQRLAIGSLVLFGSNVDGRFVIDTVFVVGDAQPLTAALIDSEPDEAFRTCTLNLLKRPAAGDHRFILYRGATLKQPIHGTYSFVPCRPASCPAT